MIEADDDGSCDITPSTEILSSWRSQNLTRAHVLGELFDNSFDWGSGSVTVEYSGKDIVVTDDGDGCDDLQGMLTAGHSSRGGKPRVGRFGVGLKDSAIWLGGATQIRSVHRGVVRTVIADWDAIARSHQWKIPRPLSRPADHGERGTRITFANVIRPMPIGKDLDKLISDLGYLFSPAIKAGKQIVFRTKGRQPIMAQRFVLPRLENIRECDVIVDGKRAHVHVGVVPEGDPNPRPGISYTHLHRVITPACGLGCNGNNYSRISGWVALDGQWKLNKNKDGVNVDEEELGAAVFGAIRDVIEVGAKQSMSIRSAHLAKSLTAMLRGMLSEVGATRDKTNDKSGTVRPKNTERKHERTTNPKPGSGRRIVDASKLNIEFKPCEEPHIGSVDLRGPTIWLAENNAWISRLRNEENLDALIGVAMGLLANASREPGAQTSFRFGRDQSEISFEKILGMLLREQSHSLRVVA